MSGQAVVYRVYDEDERLIYIGSTTNFNSRLGHHRANAWWVPLVKRYSVEIHLDVESARKAEIAAIHLEAPAFNQAHNQRSPYDPFPLTERDVQVARGFLAKGGGYLPYPMRHITAEYRAGLDPA